MPTANRTVGDTGGAQLGLLATVSSTFHTDPVSTLEGFLESNSDPWMYVIAGGAAFLATALVIGFLVPSQTVGLLAGATVSMGITQPAAVLVAMSAGAVAGNACGYLLGRKVGGSGVRRMLPRRYADQVASAQELLRRNGGAAVLVGRWNSLLRALMPSMSGAAGVPIATFLLWSIIGGVLWSVAVVGAGYLAHRSFVHAQVALGAGSVLALILVVVAVLLGLRKYRGRR